MIRRDNTQQVHWYLLEGSSHLFPIVRGLDLETQDKILRAMEELRQEVSARISEAFPSAGKPERPN